MFHIGVLFKLLNKISVFNIGKKFDLSVGLNVFILFLTVPLGIATHSAKFAAKVQIISHIYKKK